MRTLSRDTSVETEKVLTQLLRRAPVYKHLEIVSSLVKTTWQLSWLGICERHPKETRLAQAQRFFSLLYPDFPQPEKIEDVVRRSCNEQP